MVRKGGGCLGRKREGEEEKREEKEQAEEEGGEGREGQSARSLCGSSEEGMATQPHLVGTRTLYSWMILPFPTSSLNLRP